MSGLSILDKVSDEDRLRSELYDFLANLLSRPPSKETLQQCVLLTGDNTEIGTAFSALATCASSMNVRDAQREFNRLFIGLSRGELVPYASFYLTGFLNEKPLANLRSDMAVLGIERETGVSEPEDNIASICEMMAGIIAGRFGGPSDLPRQKAFFKRHMAPWATHFFKDLENAENARFYKPVGTIGRVFLEIEMEAFRMTGDAGA